MKYFIFILLVCRERWISFMKMSQKTLSRGVHHNGTAINLRVSRARKTVSPIRPSQTYYLPWPVSIAYSIVTDYLHQQ
jgi:hypothetical protein